MPDKLTVNEELNLIEVESYGPVTTEDIAASIRRTRDLLRERGLDRIIVDTRRQETAPETMEIFDLFSTFPREVKCAILVETAQSTADGQAFIETVALNRGIRIRLFREKGVALAWLGIEADEAD